MAKGVPERELLPHESFVHEIPAAQFDWIGRVTAAWAHLELTMDDLIWNMLDLSNDEGRLITNRLDASGKLLLIRALAKAQFSESRAKTLAALLTAVDDLKADRNFIVHGIWGCILPRKTPAAVSLRPKADPDRAIVETFPETRMNSICSGIDQARYQLKDLADLLSASRRRLPKPPLP